jgi:hypothetical protein
MSKEISAIAMSLITLLNNINDLVTISNKRKEARDVMNALRIYAKNSKYVLAENTQHKMDHFDAVLLDSRPLTITYLVQDITQDILKAETSSK